MSREEAANPTPKQGTTTRDVIVGRYGECPSAATIPRSPGIASSAIWGSAKTIAARRPKAVKPCQETQNTIPGTFLEPIRGTSHPLDSKKTTDVRTRDLHNLEYLSSSYCL